MNPLFPKRYEKAVNIIGYTIILFAIIFSIFFIVRLKLKGLLFIPVGFIALFIGLTLAMYKVPKSNDDNQASQNCDTEIKTK